MAMSSWLVGVECGRERLVGLWLEVGGRLGVTDMLPVVIVEG